MVSEKNLYFRKHLFCEQEMITRARLHLYVQDFVTGKNFSLISDVPEYT